MLQDIDSIVFTRIKYGFPQSVKQKYSDLTFTTSNRNPTNPKYPTVYVHEMAGQERGQDFEGTEIKAASSTFQIEVYDNISQERAEEVMNEVVKIMKKMSYSVVSMPEFINTDTYYRKVARFNRAIADMDVL